MADEQTLTNESGQTGADSNAGSGAEHGSGLSLNADSGADKGAADAAKGADTTAKPAAFPDNWREIMAPKGADGKPDSKALAVLSRYTDPTMAAKGLLDLQDKLRSGEFKRQLGKDATPEQIAEFRKESGIPEKIEDYAKVATPEGIVVGEADKQLVNSFMGKMLENNIPPAIAQQAVKAYYDNVDMVMAQQQEMDSQYVKDQEDQLRVEWGADYRANMNAISNLLSTFPESVANSIIYARGSDGRLLGDNKEFRQALAQLALERNPAATIIPSISGDTVKGIQDKINEYKELMDKDIKAWHKNTQAQAEYQKLLDKQIKMNGSQDGDRP